MENHHGRHRYLSFLPLRGRGRRSWGADDRTSPRRPPPPLESPAKPSTFVPLPPFGSGPQVTFAERRLAGNQILQPEGSDLGSNDSFGSQPRPARAARPSRATTAPTMRFM